MELPNVISDPEQYYDVDGALANNLDTEGLLRLKTVELTIKLSEGWYFIGGIIATVMAPKVYRLQQSNQTDYDNFLKKMIASLYKLHH